MSLKVWLPLTGTLDNKGTLHISLTNGGATVDTEGKTGSCYLFNGTSAYLQSNSINTSGWAEMTVAFWVYRTGSNTNLLTLRNDSSHAFRIYNNTISFRDSKNSTLRNISFTAIPQDTWMHIAIVYKRGEIWVYENGVLDKHNTTYKNTNSTLNACTNFHIGRYITTSGSAYFAGKLNDFRVYNHALSAAEVHELSQGLVRHYKLNADNLINKNTLTENSYINSSGGLKSSSNWYASDYIPVYYGNTYQTFDLSHGGSSTCVALYSNTKTFKRSITIVANENLTITPNADEFYIRLSIRNIAGELAIAKFVEVSNVIYDSSGYEKHGTVVGTTTIDNTTSRFGCSTHMNAKSSTNHIEAESLPATVQTVSLWVKSTTTGSPVIFADPLSETCLCLTSGYAAVQRATSKKTCYSLSNYSATEWNHMVITKNGTQYGLWVNGVQAEPSSTNYWTHNGDMLWLFNRNLNSSYGADASISDFRAYVTLLSDDDIKALYQVETKVARQLDMHAYELQEGQSDIAITNQGQLKCEHLEETEQASFFKDKHIETDNFIEM